MNSQVPLVAGQSIFVVYAKADRPGEVTVRRWEVSDRGGVPTDDHADFDSVEAARAAMPEGFVRVPHAPQEDPVVVETWV